MFRAFQFMESPLPYMMEAPLSVSLIAEDRIREPQRTELQFTPEDIFTTAVGHPSKRTLAKWHVTSPQEVVTELLKLVGVHKDWESDPKL
jgi:trehalose 6-phosphate synthase/phosphatase